MRRLIASTVVLGGLVLGALGSPVLADEATQAARTAKAADGASNAMGKPGKHTMRHRGTFLTDDRGRVVTIHGVNAVYKHHPYVPPANDAGFTKRDAKFLKRHGFNAVRLGVLFSGVMPTEGVIDYGYLKRIDRIVKVLAKQKIWVLLDFHQDAFNEKFDGEGFPDWAVHDDGLPFVGTGNFFLDGQTPAVQRNYDHLWANDFNLWDRYAQAWVAVAKKWRDQPYLMGYDLINEPNAGTQMSTCANPAGCPRFDATLQAFYEHVRQAIRTVDPTSMVWYEPQYLFNAISASNFTKVEDLNVGFSWHNYACLPAFYDGGLIPGDPDCQVNQPRVMDNADAQATAMGAGSLLTEFSANDDLEDIARLTKYADDHLVGWMYWAYKLWNDPTGNPAEGLFADDSKLTSVKRDKLNILVRPYAQATAGRPLSMTWDPESRTMTYTYRPHRRFGLTDVFVPRLTYPNWAYTIRVSGGEIRRVWGRQHVMIRAKKGATKVAVTITPKR
ncbi:cellulase family glycosylhydrolase [Nocardioides sp.]|uniref:cellulase family glycosylhydrolase n=1 Tax=Nocardioides sp. TaxID=35761 RepID=UPI0035681165